MLTEVAIPEDSSRSASPCLRCRCSSARPLRVIGRAARRCLAAAQSGRGGAEAGDRVVLRTEMADLLEMQGNKNLQMVDKLSSVATETVEVLISPGARLIGRRLGDMRLRRRYGVSMCWPPIAAARISAANWTILMVRVGDWALLLEGRPRISAALPSIWSWSMSRAPRRGLYRAKRRPSPFWRCCRSWCWRRLTWRPSGAGLHRGGGRAGDALRRCRRGVSRSSMAACWR